MENTVSLANRVLDKSEKKNRENNLNFLVLLAFCIDLVTPILILKGILPSSVRWVSHAAIMVMILGVISRMIVFNHIPRAFWLIVAVSVIWAFVALFRGQGILSTLWGWWLLFQFPFVALFLYLQPGWPTHFSDRFYKFALICLVIEVASQGIEFLTGATPGDSLSGMFGYNGTGDLIIFILFVICLFLGRWIFSKHWLGLFITIALGVISSILGEMKLFTIGLLITCLLAMVIYAVKNHTLGRIVFYAFFIIAALIAFENLYDLLIPGASKTPLQTYITHPQVLYDYLNLDKRYYVNGHYYTDLGRNTALRIGWKSLQDDPVTMFFGWGIGARSESVSLGTVGLGIQKGNLGLTDGTGLLIKMQEMGVVGLFTLAIFFIWVILRMLRDIRRNPSSEAVGLRYALVIFTFYWPIWLWYNNTWTLRVPMLFYWTALGYLLAESNNFPINRKVKLQNLVDEGT